MRFAAFSPTRATSPMRLPALVALLAGSVLAGCASSPPSTPAVVARPGPAPSSERDGPDAQPPPNLASVPDAEPRVEPIRVGGPNKPYEALGRDYVPMTDDRPFVERGLASWYGRKFQGRRTSSGELYNMYEMTAAHPTLPIPSYARVRNTANGREVVVRINDRGPFHSGRIVDLSYTAALKLDLLRGVAPVELERITYEEIRSGSWRRAGNSDTALAARVPAKPEVPASAAAPVAPLATAALAATAAGISAPVEAAAPSAPGPQPAPPAIVSGLPATGVEPAPPTPMTKSRSFWVQIAAFRDRSGAEAFQRRVATELDWLAPLLAIFNETAVHRLQAGPYATRDEAGSASQHIRQSLKLVPVIVERR